VFLDANILMYAVGGEHPLRAPCRTALARAVQDGIELVTDSEVLQELLYRYFAIHRPEIARAVYASATRLCREVLPVAESHTARALELLLERPDLPARDAIHAATMEGAGIRQILSTDRHFDGLEDIERIGPHRFPAC
jgi:predicted nucleic acid-binding protein